MTPRIKGKKFRVVESSKIELACKACAKEYELKFYTEREVREGVCTACGERTNVAFVEPVTLDKVEVV